MSRYIDADKLICAIDGAESLDTERDYDEIARFIEEAETADVEEVRHGQYENTTIDVTLLTQECSICKERGAVGNYCMWCGAKMDKE